jgi:hypothetical protein
MPKVAHRHLTTPPAEICPIRNHFFSRELGKYVRTPCNLSLKHVCLLMTKPLHRYCAMVNYTYELASLAAQGKNAVCISFVIDLGL